MNKTVELNASELMEIDGGKNVVEYVAYGIGWLVGAVVGGAETLGEMGDGVRFNSY